MGNRGDLTRQAIPPGGRWVQRAWITCVLTYRERRRPLDQPGRYTPLFFTDEAVALAASHRPCARCRPEAARAFKAAWARAHGQEALLTQIDHVLHRERRAHREPITVAFEEVPDGAFVRDGRGGTPLLAKGGRAYPWCDGTYAAPVAVDAAQPVEVLTPRFMLGVLRAGYVPLVAEPPEATTR